MNKVISINIGGSIFQVEEQAYEKLNSYLNELKKYFSNTQEGAEIVTDIENRIAELLRSKITPLKAAISMDDVNAVTASMGAPKDFATEEETHEDEKKVYNNDASTKSNHSAGDERSRVFRDPDARIVGGVCSGLGHYFKIDPLWIRIFFVLVSITVLKALFFGMSPVLVYIILWAIIPEAKTTAEKLQMRKEQINIDNIQKSVQTEFNKVKETLESKDFQKKATSLARKLADFIRMIIMGVLQLARRLAKFFFVFLGVIALLIAFSALTGNILYHDSTYFHGGNLFHFFENRNDKLLAQASVFFGSLAAGFMLLMFAQLVSRNKLSPKAGLVFKTATIIINIIAFVLLVSVVSKVTRYFSSGQKVENVMVLDSTRHHFYLRNIAPDFYVNSYEGFHLDYFLEDSLKINEVKILIKASDGASGSVIETRSSRGQNKEMAKLNASNILALSSVNDSVINLSSSFSLLNNQVYRNQELLYSISLPIGSKFTIEEGIYANISIASKNGDVYAHAGNTYRVTENGIECDDCTKTYGSEGVNTSSYPLNISLNGHEFKKVDVSSSINLKIVRGNNFVIKARGTNNLDDLDIDFDGDEVSISDNRSWNFILGHTKSLEVIVVMPALSELQASGSADVFVDGFNEEELKIELSGASSCNTNFEVRRLAIDMGGASRLHLDGKVFICNASISGASKLHALGVAIGDVTVDLSGASFAEVNCTDKLNVEASGASTFKYQGAVKEIVSKNSGASRVERMD